MPRYKEGFEQVAVYIPIAEYNRLHIYWQRQTDKNLSACAARLLMERINQVAPAAPNPPA